MASVTIPPVRAFSHVAPDKAQALKPLEEAAEVFGAWQMWDGMRELSSPVGDWERDHMLNECADVIQAVCNLLSALGVDDMTDAMAACEQRNRERGRYGDR